MNRIYRRKNYNIYQYDKGYIIHNIKQEFSQSHTHVNNYNTCKYLIDLALHKTVPYHLSDYLLMSLIRISDDENYCDKIRLELEKNKLKKKNRRD